MTPLFQRLLPAGDPIAPLDLVAETRPWERAPAGRPLVLVNMVATADGRITIGGRSGPIGGPGDQALFHALRTCVDAVMVGTGTLRVERYGRLVRAEERRARRVELGLSEDPYALLISRTGQVPWEAPLFAAPEQTVILVTHPGAATVPDVAAKVELVELPVPSPAAALREVSERFGIRAILCEGGPTLNRALILDGVLDELFLTLGPLVAGGDDPLRILAGDELPEPERLRLLSVARHEDELYLRYALDAQ